MAVFHLSAKTISRSQGRSATAAAAYRSGSRIEDDRQGLVFDFSRKEGIREAHIIAPDGAPAHLRDRTQLWNAAERAERRKDAMVARELEVALPRELGRGTQAALIHDFVTSELTSRGLVADVAIHDATAEDGRPQPHAHVLFKDRTVDSATNTGFAAKKDRTFSHRSGIEALRQSWEQHANAALERARSPERIDRRSLADQRAEAAQERIEAEATAQAAGRHPEHDPDAADAAAREMAATRPSEGKAGPAARGLARRGRRSPRWSRVRRVRKIRQHVRGIVDGMRQAAIEAREAEREAAPEPASPPPERRPRNPLANAVDDALAGRRPADEIVPPDHPTPTPRRRHRRRGRSRVR